jgi:hypothetical protein
MKDGRVNYGRREGRHHKCRRGGAEGVEGAGAATQASGRSDTAGSHCRWISSLLQR